MTEVGMGGTSKPGLMVLAPYGGRGDDDIADVPGAHVITADCGHLAWMSPTGDDFIVRSPLVNTTCFDCAPSSSQVWTVPGAHDLVERMMTSKYGPEKAAAFRRDTAELREYPGD